MLVIAVVVNGNDAASNIRVVADNCIPEVTQMACLSTAPDGGLFRFDEITDAVLTLQTGPFAQIGKRSDVAIFPDKALFCANSELKVRPVADRHVTKPGGTFNQHTRADSAASHYLHIWTDGSVTTDLYFGADVRS